MSTITLPNIRVGSDLQVRVRLKDGGVAIDWSTLQNIKACIYSDAQRALAGRCSISIDAEDSTLLVCNYAANKPQYLGANRVVISVKYLGETKTYDKPAFTFVRWTDDQAGEQITIDDPDVDVEIEVEDISSSILQEAVDAAFEAADRANDAAAAAEHMVDIHTGPEGKSAYEVAVEEGYVGTEEEWLASLVGPQGAQGIQGETGEAAGFGTVSVSLQEDGGQPSATVAASGTDTAKNFAFTFNNLKGEKGDKGDQGNSGYTGAAGELEVVNNLTDGGAAKALSAEMGKTLEGEVSQLEAKVDGITLTWQEGYINSSGVLTAPDGYSQITSQKLSADEANGIKISFDGTYYCVRIAYFNGNTLVSRTNLIDTSPYTIETEYSVYITLCTKYYTSYTMSQMLGNYTFDMPGGLIPRVSSLETSMGIIEPEVQDLNITVYGIPLVWTSGNIDANGAVITPTQSNYYSQIIPNSQINGISLEVDAGYLCNLAFYDNGIFVSRYGWIYNNAGKVTISTQYDARIMIGRDTYDNTKTAEEVAAHIHITGIEEGLEKRVERLEAVNNSSEFLSRMVACDFNGKILHFSFDDVCWCLYDLIQNEATYTDIFDEPFFAMLKEVHDSTGMVFTLNTFNEIGANSSGYYPTGFDIENVPTKFQSDFQANKGWLKFAFHAKDEDTNYNTASGAGTDYGVFVSAIYTLTGDYDCIDRVTRLGFFGGNLENCLALRDDAHGPIGFFGADDSRAYDYYLTADQYGWLRKKGKFFDIANGLFFIKTQYRTFATGEQDVEKNLCFQKVTEFFAHEYEAHLGASWDLTSMKNNILSLATWATGLGYKFYYPESIYN